jgi:hypothetical protein
VGIPIFHKLIEFLLQRWQTGKDQTIPGGGVWGVYGFNTSDIPELTFEKGFHGPIHHRLEGSTDRYTINGTL